MAEQAHDLPSGWWADNLEELDTEIARLAVICGVRILEPGVVQRVLQKDASVCGSPNPPAFAKLHGLLMVHFAIRAKSVDVLGASQTAAIETYVVERLKARFQQLLA
jgi:hypothetical protein